MTTAPNGELRRQDFHLQVQQRVSLRPLRGVTVAHSEGATFSSASEQETPVDRQQRGRTASAQRVRCG